MDKKDAKEWAEKSKAKERESVEHFGISKGAQALLDELLMQPLTDRKGEFAADAEPVDDEDDE